MIIERDTTHEALHAAGASTVRRVQPGVFEVEPDIDVALLDQTEIETAQAQTKRRLTAAVQQHLDAAAQERGYDNVFTACTYADEPSVPEFQAEGQAFRGWRSKVWQYCYAQLDAVTAGTRTTPTEAELIAEIDANVPLALP